MAAVESNPNDIASHAIERDTQPAGLDELHARVGNVETGMASMRHDLSENTLATKRIEASVASIVETWNDLAGAFSVLEKLGRLAKPVGALAAAAVSIGGFWQALKHGFWIGK